MEKQLGKKEKKKIWRKTYPLIRGAIVLNSAGKQHHGKGLTETASKRTVTALSGVALSN